MKIGVAQTRPIKGDISANIIQHKQLIALAVGQGADILVFPELSITGYEPELARELATTPDDSRFDDFQLISNESKVIIGIGVPLQSEAGVLIGLVIFESNKPRRVYAKQFLHADEVPYFVPGDGQVFLSMDETKIAFSICYELSVPEHAAYAHEQEATVYLSSVAKTAVGATRAIETLRGIAEQYGMAVLMSSCIGPCDNFDAGGRSAVIDNQGKLLAQLNDTHEGLLIFDTDTSAIIEKVL
jgi:predicted amidohydrolase